MSSLQSNHVFTSESVSEGHPDKIADQISDAILDACIRQDPHAHVACETAVGPNLVVNLGEITCKGWEAIDPEAIARGVVRDIGYDRPAEAFSFDTLKYVNALHGQSPDINQGVQQFRSTEGAVLVDVREEDDQFQSPLDMLFKALEEENPNHVALKQYKIFKQAAGKTAKSILISAGVRLAAFNIPQYAYMTRRDDMDFGSLGEKKRAIFCVIPIIDTSMNYLIGMLYTCAHKPGRVKQ